jgi:hypothetical protein
VLALVVLQAVAPGLAVLTFWLALCIGLRLAHGRTGAFLWSTIVGCATPNLWEEATWIALRSRRGPIALQRDGRRGRRQLVSTKTAGRVVQRRSEVPEHDN